MDMFEDICRQQIAQDSYWNDKAEVQNDKNVRREYAKSLGLNIHDQLSKFLLCFDWKKHHVLDSIEDIVAAQEQLLDIFKYSLGGMLMLGLDIDHVYQLFCDKTALLEKRWEAELESGYQGQPIVVFDIDGVIADYESAYIDFIRLYHPEIIIPNDIKDRDSYSFHRHFGIDKSSEEQFQHEFAVSGWYENIPAYKGIAKTISSIRQYGVKIVLITARPAWKYPQLKLQTFNALRKYKVSYDLIFWDKDKADAVSKHLAGMNVVAFVEDRDKHALELSHIDVPVILINRPYNKSVQGMEGITCIDDCELLETLKVILGLGLELDLELDLD